MKKEFNINGMTCSACALNVEKAVKKLEGVNEVNVNLLTNSMKVDYDNLDEKVILEAVDKAGYSAWPIGDNSKDIKKATAETDELLGMKKRLIISFLFLIPLMYIAMGSMVELPVPKILLGAKNSIINAFTQFLLCLPIIFVNRKYYINGYKGLIRKMPNMDSLVAIGSSAALVYGIFIIYKLSFLTGHGYLDVIHHYMHSLYFESAATILALITLGKYLETKSKGKTTAAIKKLMDLAPKTAIKVNGDIEEVVSLDDVKVGDILLVKPGNAIPVDGLVVLGRASVDESAITGESIPLEKNVGDKVTGSTILKIGSLRVKAEKVGEDTTLSKIIKLVQDANATKAPIAKFADKIAGVFVPVVILIAILTFIVWYALGKDIEFALTNAISVLVISCPCALGLATPVAIMVATGKGASLGILIKSAQALESLYDVEAVILDKTGTITEGRPVVTDIISFKFDKNTLLEIASSLEKLSEHPLSNAIIDKAKEENIEIKACEDFENILGKGLKGKIEGKLYYAGNKNLLNQIKIKTEFIENDVKKLSEDGKTVLYFANEEELIGLIAVCDKIKASSKEAIESLKSLGLEVYMLTGDNKSTAMSIAKEVNLDEVISEVLPEDKDNVVRKIKEKGKKVAMVGDGINDAPALARADVGIAIGAGTDIAIDAADIVLVKSDLLDVTGAIELSRATIKNIKENLFWAFFYNVLCIPLAAGVFYNKFGISLNPMIASAAMSFSSIFVVTNALRLNSFRYKKYNQSHNYDVNSDKLSGLNINNNGEIKMEKIMKIEGMMCGHCKARVEDVLNKLDGVEAVVDLEKKEAKIKMKDQVEDEVLKKAVVDAGYEVLSIE